VPQGGTEHPWSIARSGDLYGLNRWGDPYFSINSRGHVVVQPRGDRGGSIDLMELLSVWKSATFPARC